MSDVVFNSSDQSDRARTTSSVSADAFVVTNYTEDLAMDCDTAADAEIADVLGTLINSLQESGIIAGTTSA